MAYDDANGSENGAQNIQKATLFSQPLSLDDGLSGATTGHYLVNPKTTTNNNYNNDPNFPQCTSVEHLVR